MFQIALCTELMDLHFGDTDTYPLRVSLQPFLHMQITKYSDSPWQLEKAAAGAAHRNCLKNTHSNRFMSPEFVIFKCQRHYLHFQFSLCPVVVWVVVVV